MVAVLKPMLQDPPASCIQVFLPMMTEYRRGCRWPHSGVIPHGREQEAVVDTKSEIEEELSGTV